MRRPTAHFALAILASCITAGARVDSVLAGGPLPQPGGFTYQFQLRHNGQLYNGTADFEFRLWDGPEGTGATQIGPTIPQTQTIADGTSNTILFFEQPPPAPPVWDGNERWLEVRVRTPAGSANPFVGLTPWQRITNTPYAAYALNSNTPFAFDNSNAIFMGGNVGIGIAEPNAKLYVSGGSSTEPVLWAAGQAGADIQLDAGSSFNGSTEPGQVFIRGGYASSVFGFAAGAVDLRGGEGGSANNGGAVFILGGSTSGASLSGGHVELQGGNATGAGGHGGDIYLRGGDGLGSDGNVGINTLGVPLADLHIFEDSQDSRIRVESANGLAGISLFSDSAGEALMYSPQSSNDLRLHVGGLDRMSVGAAGAVGIGTITPANRLDVEGAAAIGAAYSGTSAAPANSLIVEGNVGIGTAAPTEPLHIVDSLFSTVLLDRTGGSRASLSAQGSAASVGTTNSFPFRLISNNSVRLTVAPTGEIGIGTATPANPLHVNGAGTASGGFGTTTDVVAHLRNPTSLQGTALSIDALSGQDSTLYLAEGGVSQWSIRADASSDSFHINKGSPTSVPALAFNGTGATFSAEFLGHVKPYDNDLLDLGTLSDKWRDIYATNGVIITSDRRSKTDVTDIDDGLQRLMQLRPVSYFRLDRAGEPLRDRRHLGLVAQEVEPIVPEAVRVPSAEGEMYAMQYEMLIPLLIDATQTLERENQSLQAENESLAARLASLEAMVEQLMSKENRR